MIEKTSKVAIVTGASRADGGMVQSLLAAQPAQDLSVHLTRIAMAEIIEFPISHIGTRGRQ